MKRRIAIVSTILVIVGIGVLIVTAQKPVQVNETKENKSSVIEEDPKSDVKEEQSDEQQESEEEKLPVQVKELVSEAVQNTIDYFSNNESHIVAIGDSLTQGVGDSTGKGGYVGILERTINKSNQIVTIENYGKRGNRSDQLLKRLNDPKIATSISNADIVLITIGANDIMKVVKENFTNLTYKDFVKERVAYEERLKKIFSKIKLLNSHASIYLLGFYNPFEKYFPEIKELGLIVEDFNSTGKKVAGMYENVSFIPTIDLFDDHNVDLFAKDNFHPNTLGYKRIAKRVLKALVENEEG